MISRWVVYLAFFCAFFNSFLCFLKLYNWIAFEQVVILTFLRFFGTLIVFLIVGYIIKSFLEWRIPVLKKGLINTPSFDVTLPKEEAPQTSTESQKNAQPKPEEMAQAVRNMMQQ
jgi:amino acid permease